MQLQAASRASAFPFDTPVLPASLRPDEAEVNPADEEEKEIAKPAVPRKARVGVLARK